MITTAWANDRPKTTTARPPYTTNSTFHTAPAHIQNRPAGLPQRRSSGTCSMPRCSIVVTDGSASADSTAALRPPDPAASLTVADLPTLVLGEPPPLVVREEINPWARAEGRSSGSA